MVLFFKDKLNAIFAVDTPTQLSQPNIKKLEWLFVAKKLDCTEINSVYIGPKKTMTSPWSTNAVEITQNMAIHGIKRIENFIPMRSLKEEFDPMIFEEYSKLNQNLFEVLIKPEPILEVENISHYNDIEGLALNNEEIKYLENLSTKLNRKLTDSEVFGFSQVNSEHCRHKIFNGKFIIDDEEKDESLFKLIKKTSRLNPNEIVSAYKDNVAFVKGPVAEQFAPKNGEKPSFFEKSKFNSVISLKAETHNFPTTVEPFNGAATGSGGEIRDRLAGGKGSLPLAGTAVYMTSYPRIGKNRKFSTKERNWLYQKPVDILIKASNGASDFGNKFGQPLISGSVLTFEHEENDKTIGFDKVIMLAGGIGYGKENQSLKSKPKDGDVIVVLGDGECNEGSVWEAAMMAAAQRVGNLMIIVDFNKWQATGRSEEVLALSPLVDKWRAFGWDACEFDGHDMGQLIKVLSQEKPIEGKPIAVIAHTVKGKGVSFMEDDNNWHYKIPSAEELASALKELGVGA